MSQAQYYPEPLPPQQQFPVPLQSQSSLEDAGSYSPTILSQTHKLQMLRLSQSGSQDSPVVSLELIQRQTSDESDSAMPRFLRDINITVLDNKSSDQLEIPYKHNSIEYYREELTSEEKNRLISDTDYHRIVIEHMKKWKHMARDGFGFTDAKISQIEYDHRKFEECAFQSFSTWKMSSGLHGPVSLWTIIEALHKAKQYEAIHFLMEDVYAKRPAEPASH